MEISHRIPFSVFDHPYAGAMVDDLRLVKAQIVGSFLYLICQPSIGQYLQQGPYDVFDNVMLEGDV